VYVSPVKLQLLVIFCAGCVGPAVDVSNQAATQICAAGSTVTGIDVSHWDGAIDWSKMKADGVEFAFMKATEGLTFVDPNFATYWADAPPAGVIRGAYHFFHANDDPVQQADFFIATAGIPEAGDFPLTIDLEVNDGLTGDQVGAAALTFLERVESVTGRTPIIYTSARVYDSVLGSPPGNWGHYPLWDADYVDQCPNISSAWSGWAFWQNTDTGKYGGLTGLDVDHFNGSMSDLMTFVNPPQPTPDDGVVADMAQPPAVVVDMATPPDLGGAGKPPGCGCTVGERAPTSNWTIFAVAVLLLGAAFYQRIHDE
jgi:lysozyme